MKTYRIYSADTGDLVAEGTAIECAERLGMARSSIDTAIRMQGMRDNWKWIIEETGSTEQVERICAYFGRKFLTRPTPRKYCSDDCQKKERAERKRIRAGTTLETEAAVQMRQESQKQAVAILKRCDGCAYYHNAKDGRIKFCNYYLETGRRATPHHRPDGTCAAKAVRKKEMVEQ